MKRFLPLMVCGLAVAVTLFILIVVRLVRSSTRVFGFADLADSSDVSLSIFMWTRHGIMLTDLKKWEKVFSLPQDGRWWLSAPGKTDFIVQLDVLESVISVWNSDGWTWSFNTTKADSVWPCSIATDIVTGSLEIDGNTALTLYRRDGHEESLGSFPGFADVKWLGCAGFLIEYDNGLSQRFHSIDGTPAPTWPAPSYVAYSVSTICSGCPEDLEIRDGSVFHRSNGAILFRLNRGFRPFPMYFKRTNLGAKFVVRLTPGEFYLLGGGDVGLYLGDTSGATRKIHDHACPIAFMQW